MKEATRKTGKKGRKIGRGLKKPSHKRYTAEKRWETNKARRIAKQARAETKKKAKIEKIKKTVLTV